MERAGHDGRRRLPPLLPEAVGLNPRARAAASRQASSSSAPGCQVTQKPTHGSISTSTSSMCNTAGFSGGGGDHHHHNQGAGGGHHPQQQHQQQQQGVDCRGGVSMLTHTPPCRYEETTGTSRRAGNAGGSLPGWNWSARPRAAEARGPNSSRAVAPFPRPGQYIGCHVPAANAGTTPPIAHQSIDPLSTTQQTWGSGSGCT